MIITADVINDLLPVYLAGEASRDTRSLIEEYLRDHPELARRIRDEAARAATLLAEIAPAPAEAREKTDLERVRRFARQRSYVLAFAIAYSLLPFGFSFSGGAIDWLMLRDNPKAALMFAIAGLGCWIAHYVMGRRLRQQEV